MNASELDPINDVPLGPRPGIVDPPDRYGHFDEDTGEYVITRPDTPQPWYNYITNGSFTGFVSHTGGGTCYALNDSVEKRILRTHLHCRPADQPGRWIYIRDRDNGVFHAATWAPVYTPLNRFKYECRVGPGASTITAECNRIRSEVTYFVGPDAEAEIWLLTVTNPTRRTRRLDVFPYAEFLLWSLARDSNLDAAFKCTDIAVNGRVIVHRSYYDWGAERGGWKRQYAYFASSTAPSSFDTNLEAFVGVFRGYDRPLALAAGRCSNFNNRGGQPVAAMQIPLTLKGGGSRTIAFAVGYAGSDAEASRQGRRVGAVAFAREQLAKVRRHWRGYLDRFQAETPDATFHVPFNTLTPYQSAITFVCSRSISPYQLTGGRGLGYRDSNQDTLGAMPYQSRRASRKLIATLLGVQKKAGDACHDFFPGPGAGAGGGYSDDHLWSALSVEWYVKESGDLAFLNRKIAFHDSDTPAAVIDHLERALRFAERNAGVNGLPLLRRADWNDCLNAFEGAESVFTAGLYCAAAKAVESLHTARGDLAKARRCAKRHAAMAERINQAAWDGAWYRRLITREGKPVGSRSNRHGRIYIESNVWAVIGQAAPPDRARQALDSVREHLGTPYGHRLCAPPYPDYDPSVGTLGIFAPGYKENGAIFCHTNPWLIVAEAMLGRGDRAWDVFARLSPYTKDQIQNVHCAEPYALSSMIVMPPNLEAGRARNPWLTGFVSWMLAAMGRRILGVRPDFDGLVIDPCVPRWRRFGVRRVFRGTTYEIEVDNPDGVERGVREVRVDGREVEGNKVPVRKGAQKVRVKVTMG